MRRVYPFEVPAASAALAQRGTSPRASFRVTTADVVTPNEPEKPAAPEHVPPAFLLEETEGHERDAQRVGEHAAPETALEPSEDL